MPLLPNEPTLVRTGFYETNWLWVRFLKSFYVADFMGFTF